MWIPEFPRLSPLSPISHFLLAVFHFYTEFLGLNVAHGSSSLSFYGLSSKSCLSMVWPRCHGPIPKIGLLCHSWVPVSTLCLSLSISDKQALVHFSKFPSSNHEDNILLILVCLLPISRILTWALIQWLGPCRLVEWFFWCWIWGYHQDPLSVPYSCVSLTMNSPKKLHVNSLLSTDPPDWEWYYCTSCLSPSWLALIAGSFPHYLSFQRADKMDS